MALCCGLLLSGCALRKAEFAARPEFGSEAGRVEALAPSPGAVAPSAVSLPRAPVVQQPELASIGRLPELPPVDDLPPPASAHPDLPVSLDMEQADLRQLLETIADALEISLVIDPAIAEKVSIRTAPGRPLRHKDLWPLLRLLASDHGVALEKRGAVYHAKKVANPLPSSLVFGRQSGGEAPLVLQLCPLQHVAADVLSELLKPLLEGKARLMPVGGLNLLGVVASPGQLERINSLITLLDADPFKAKGLRLFRLEHAGAATVAAELEKILGLVAGERHPYGIVALERINALLAVVPTGADFGELERWVRILDASSQDSTEQLFIYRVRNLNAESLAATLSKTLGGGAGQAREGQPPSSPSSPIRPALASAVQDRKAASPLPSPTAMPAATPALSPPGAASAAAPVADLRAGIVADADTNTLLIRATPRDYRQLLESIAALDQVPKQVMVNVVIAEVTLTDATRFGVQWDLLARSGKLAVQSVIGIGGILSNSDARGLILSNVGGELTSLLNFLGQETDLKVLSRPSILVRNNQKAEIKVGSEEPILTSVVNSTETVAGSTQLRQDVQYRDTGIILKVTPRINEDRLISIEIDQEVSQLGEERTAQKLPSFTNRRIKTSAVLRDKNAIVLGGIIQSRRQNGKTGIPGLMDIPVAGLLFSDTDLGEVRTELVLIIVPELVDPAADNTRFVQDFIDRLQAVKALVDLGPAPAAEGGR